ncbi:MAG: transporter substrate-binding domain-containing protein [Deltaproteobacteria bacterium]|nr:transporter substrate-binding domain-containing protein [Deltaproteobacteria bacterium]
MNCSRNHIQIIFVTLIFVYTVFNPSVSSAKRIINIGVPRFLPPFSFVDPNTVELRGFCVDLSILLVNSMGIDAKPQFFGYYSPRLEQALEEGNLDLVVGITIPSGGRDGLNMIDTGITVDRKIFANKTCVTVTCTKDLPGQIVAFEKGRDLRSSLPVVEGVSFIQTDSHLKALSLVDSGKASVYISDSRLTSLYLIQKNNFENIKEVGLPVDSVPLSLAVRSDNTELLADVSLSLGKILKSEDYDAIYRKWLGQEIRFSHWDEYLKYIVGALGLSASVLLFFIFWNFMLKRKVQEVTRDFQRSEKKYRDLIESSPEMIHLISPDGNIRLINRIAMQYLKYNESEMIKLNLSDLVSPDNRDEISDFINIVFSDGFGNKEVVFLAKDGTETPAEIVATTVGGLVENEPMACCFSRDITEHKRLEEELVKSERLGIMGQMAAGLAHEINNPLGIIVANAEAILEDGMDSEYAHESLMSIERNAIRAGKIIEDLLSFTGPSALEKGRVNLSLLIDETLPFLKQKLKQKNIKVKRPESSEEIIFYGDENQIQQLLVNLILNAIQAMQDDGILTICARYDGDGENREIILEVEDTGIGVTDEDLPRIFDPFFTSRKEKGFGLGLFISRVIVEKHNGRISARSNEGLGTVFTVALPA